MKKRGAIMATKTNSGLPSGVSAVCGRGRSQNARCQCDADETGDPSAEHIGCFCHHQPDRFDQFCGIACSPWRKAADQA